MEKAISLILVLLVVTSCLSRFSEARTVETCHKNSDCVRTSCAGSFVLCVNGICTCEVSSTSRDEPAPVTDGGVVRPSCTNPSQCEVMRPWCVEGQPACVDGRCTCQVSGTSREESAPAVTNGGVVPASCSSPSECILPWCIYGQPTCAHGTCICL